VTARTRVLFLTSPGVGHVFPVVPTAWAARAAGAQVLVGTTGAGVAAADRAGLPVVDVLPGGDLAPLRAGFLRRMPGTPHDRRFAIAMELFGAIADAMADGAVALARGWRPDLVVHTPLQEAGPLVAEVLGVPCVEHGFQLTGVGRTHDLLAPHLAGAAARHGVAGVRTPDAALDLCPPSVLTGPPYGRVLGYRPYNGGAVLDPAVLAGPGRPRVVVTTGTAFGDDGARVDLLASLAQLDVDVLLAGEPPAGALPPNVTAPGWVPLDLVLPGAALLVHHGGAGSALCALWAGVPQVIASEGADHDFNAAALTRRGAGVSGVGDIVGTVRSVLADPSARAAAAEVAAEIAELPGPERVVPELLADLLGVRSGDRLAVGA
jgi:UDP:flavonoid glycosyltransferase YjiC (YdhE family)